MKYAAHILCLSTALCYAPLLAPPRIRGQRPLVSLLKKSFAQKQPLSPKLLQDNEAHEPSDDGSTVSNMLDRPEYGKTDLLITVLGPDDEQDIDPDESASNHAEENVISPSRLGGSACTALQEGAQFTALVKSQRNKIDSSSPPDIGNASPLSEANLKARENEGIRKSQGQHAVLALDFWSNSSNPSSPASAHTKLGSSHSPTSPVARGLKRDPHFDKLSACGEEAPDDLSVTSIDAQPAAKTLPLPPATFPPGNTPILALIAAAKMQRKLQENTPRPRNPASDSQSTPSDALFAFEQFFGSQPEFQETWKETEGTDKDWDKWDRRSSTQSSASGVLASNPPKETWGSFDDD